MKKFAVIGNPIAHSRSPSIHSVFGMQTGIALSYEKLLAPIDGFKQAVSNFFAQGGVGLNVTVPFKEEAFAYCDSLTPRAQVAKAVNTLWMQAGQLYGDNTDGQGLVFALQRLFADRFSLTNANVLILGAGGATRGVIYPLLEAGVNNISIANRSSARAQQLVLDMQLLSEKAHTSLHTLDINRLVGNFDVIVNATSASLQGDGITLPDSLNFNYAYDMAYGKPSTFLDTAKARGVPYADGLSMLIYQAAEAFRVWHGIMPVVDDGLFQQINPACNT